MFTQSIALMRNAYAETPKLAINLLAISTGLFLSAASYHQLRTGSMAGRVPAFAAMSPDCMSRDCKFTTRANGQDAFDVSRAIMATAMASPQFSFAFDMEGRPFPSSQTVVASLRPDRETLTAGKEAVATAQQTLEQTAPLPPRRVAAQAEWPAQYHTSRQPEAGLVRFDAPLRPPMPILANDVETPNPASVPLVQEMAQTQEPQAVQTSERSSSGHISSDRLSWSQASVPPEPILRPPGQMRIAAAPTRDASRRTQGSDSGIRASGAPNIRDIQKGAAQKIEPGYAERAWAMLIGRPEQHDGAKLGPLTFWVSDTASRGVRSAENFLNSPFRRVPN